MREETVYLWRTQWCGKWSTTRYYCTEAHIRKEHPWAVRVNGSAQVRQMPDTAEEHHQAQCNTSTSAFLRAKKIHQTYKPGGPENHRE